MKTSLIFTVLNEEKTINKLFDSIHRQTKLSTEVIIVDGGSTDKTVSNINKIQKNNSFLPIKVIIKKGNRSVGRNEAIKQATGDIIMCSDGGCILDKNWIKEIIKPFIDPEVGVVAGYYKSLSRNVFQKCLIPYVFVMEDKINPRTFLPASRSMAFRKKAWDIVGGFDEKLSHNEDYDFAKRLKKNGIQIKFQKGAIVYWIPRNSIQESFIMFYRFAYGDAEAGLFRGKVIIIFVRYIIGISLVIYYLIYPEYFMLYTLCFIFSAYFFWSIYKNYKYVNDMRAFIYLPLLQLTSDIAVMLGSLSAVPKLIVSKLNRL